MSEHTTVDETRIDTEAPPVTLVERVDGAADRYEPLTELGRGGMGEVRLSRDRRIGRTVAVKRAMGDGSRDRFFREICVQGQLEHPAVVPLLVGTNGDVGIWHETYKSRPGDYESIYANMPLFGLSKAGQSLPAEGRYARAATRLRPDQEAA